MHRIYYTLGDLVPFVQFSIYDLYKKCQCYFLFHGCFTRFCKNFTKSRKAFHMFRYKNNYTNDGILVSLLLTLNTFNLLSNTLCENLFKINNKDSRAMPMGIALLSLLLTLNRYLPIGYRVCF